MSNSRAQSLRRSWREDSGKFTPYDAIVDEQIEAAYQRWMQAGKKDAQAETSVMLRGRVYVISFKELRQWPHDLAGKYVLR